MRPWKVLEEGLHLRIRRRLLNEYAVLNVLAVAIGVLVGMGAMFAAASRATLTSIVIVFELTGDYKFILPLMLACVVSDAVTLVFKEDTIYTGELRRRGIPFDHDIEVFRLKLVPVERAMLRDVPTVSEDDTISKVANHIILTGHNSFPVLDRDGRLAGILTGGDVRRAISRGQGNAPVADAATKKVEVVLPTTSLAEAMERMAALDIGHLPVVDPDDRRKLVGILSRSDVIRAYKQRAMEETVG